MPTTNTDCLDVLGAQDCPTPAPLEAEQNKPYGWPLDASRTVEYEDIAANELRHTG